MASKVVERYILNEKTVKSEKYIKWLHSFLKIHPNFCDNDFLYDENAQDETKYNASLLSTLFNVIVNYYDEFGIKAQDIKTLNALYTKRNSKENSLSFSTSVVSVNFNDFSAKLTTIVSQGAITSIEIIEKGTGLCDFKDVLEVENILTSNRKKIIDRIKNFKA